MTISLLKYGTIVAVSVILGFILQGWRMGATISDLKAKHEVAITASVAQAHEETLRLQRIKDEAIEKANKLVQSNAASADRARSELERMRVQLRQDTVTVSQATRESLSDYTIALQFVFAECSSELTEMARKADGHALDARTLKEAWGETK